MRGVLLIANWKNPWGQQSSARLKQLVPVGQAITLRAVETDKYKRTCCRGVCW